MDGHSMHAMPACHVHGAGECCCRLCSGLPQVSRVLAAKCALAIRVDALGDSADASIGLDARAKVCTCVCTQQQLMCI
jgi:hypothetical protein